MIIALVIVILPTLPAGTIATVCRWTKRSCGPSWSSLTRLVNHRSASLPIISPSFCPRSRWFKLSLVLLSLCRRCWSLLPDLYSYVQALTYSFAPQFYHIMCTSIMRALLGCVMCASTPGEDTFTKTGKSRVSITRSFFSSPVPCFAAAGKKPPTGIVPGHAYTLQSARFALSSQLA